MKGCLVPAVAVALVAVPSSGVARDPAPQERFPCAAFQLKHADAARCVRKLRALLGEGSEAAVFPEEDTNSIFIRARPEKNQQAREILHRIDVAVPNYLTIIPLKHADAARTADPLQVILTLAAFFRDDDCEIRVLADVRANSVLILASEETMQEARTILHWLDVQDK